MEKLRELRKKAGYSIYDMARMLEITPAFYSQLENGKRRLFYDMAIKLSSLFHLRPDDIFYDGKY